MNQETMTLEQQIEQLKAENALLKSQAPVRGDIKISEKGCVSVYGLGRFPVTLYASQWENLFGKQDAIKEFIIANIEKLSTKAAKA